MVVVKNTGRIKILFVGGKNFIISGLNNNTNPAGLTVWASRTYRELFTKMAIGVFNWVDVRRLSLFCFYFADNSETK